MDGSMRRIEDALAKMKALASKASVLLLVLFLADCAFVLTMLVLQVPHIVTGSFDGHGLVEGIRLFASIMDFVVYGAILIVARNIAKDIASGRSPFTLDNARQIAVIAGLFIASFVLGLLDSANYSSLTSVGGVELGIDPDSLGKYPSLFIDIKSLVGAVTGFLLSGAWKYGALLQADSDDFL